MISVRGVYENGQITLLEKIPHTKKAKVIVTILEEEANQEEIAMNLFDDLVGAVSIREDGSTNHDEYIAKNNR